MVQSGCIIADFADIVQRQAGLRVQFKQITTASTPQRNLSSK